MNSNQYILVLYPGTMNVLDLSGTNGPIDASLLTFAKRKAVRKASPPEIRDDDQLGLDIHEVGDAKA